MHPQELIEAIEENAASAREEYGQILDATNQLATSAANRAYDFGLRNDWKLLQSIKDNLTVLQNLQEERENELS